MGHQNDAFSFAGQPAENPHDFVLGFAVQSTFELVFAGKRQALVGREFQVFERLMERAGSIISTDIMNRFVCLNRFQEAISIDGLSRVISGGDRGKFPVLQ